MNVLAFDIAHRTGFAVTDKHERKGVSWGSFEITCDGEEGIGRGLRHFVENLEALLATHPVQCLAWEKPIPASRHSAAFDEFQKAVIGLLRMTAFDRDLQVLPCDMKSVRRHFIGDGTRFDAKAQVWQRCRVLGYEVANDDESDAIATWDYAVGVMKAREYARSSRSFGGKGGRKIAAPGRPGSHRRL